MSCPLNPSRTTTPNEADASTPNEADADASTPNEADADASTPSEADVSTPSDSSDEDILLSELAPKKQSTCAFPFRIGTFVAFEFPQGIFVGHITKLYPGEDLCQVTFTDGDIGDYDTDEILYATQLYEREFPESSDWILCEYGALSYFFWNKNTTFTIIYITTVHSRSETCVIVHVTFKIYIHNRMSMF